MSGPTPRAGFRYVRSADGTSIAYLRDGAGPPLVVVPPVPLSNVGGDLTVPLMRDAYASLARDFELILYDGRGTGASQRSASDFSAEALSADLDAVLVDAGVSAAALLAMYLAGPAALTYAARRPERVSHLVLYGVADHGRRALEHPGSAALISLIDEDWELFTKTAALDWMGWGVGESGRLVAESFRTTTTPEIARAALQAYGETDVRPLLPDVAASTLILHRRHGRHVPMEQSTDLAAAIPEAQLHVLDGESSTLFFDDPMGTVRVIGDFIQPGLVGRTSARDVSAERADLTGRELEVLRLIAAGDSNAEIAARLDLSVHTVERHAANLYRKIDARGRADATAWAIRNGLDR